ncbi:MAG TPA: hypothetical protein VHE13_02610 [Opitutus sp.]|nr:hypothetical protein [Opitutus sp.]
MPPPANAVATQPARTEFEADSLSRRLYCTALVGFLSTFEVRAPLPSDPGHRRSAPRRKHRG